MERKTVVRGMLKSKTAPIDKPDMALIPWGKFTVESWTQTDAGLTFVCRCKAAEHQFGVLDVELRNWTIRHGCPECRRIKWNGYMRKYQKGRDKEKTPEQKRKWNAYMREYQQRKRREVRELKAENERLKAELENATGAGRSEPTQVGRTMNHSW